MKVKQSIALDQEVIDELKKMADKSGVSLSSLVNDILKGGLDSRHEMLKELETVNLLDLVRDLKKALKPVKK